MTNQAIIIINPLKNKDLLFKELKGKIFLHYQLRYLAENLIKKIVIIEPIEAPPLKSILGTSYLDMELDYVKFNKNHGESQSLIEAFELVDDIYAYVFDAHHYFRLNLAKADDFRRMRESRMLHIGIKSEGFIYKDLPHILLNDRGRIEEITDKIEKQEADTFFTNTWLINKRYFQRQFNSTESSLLELLKARYEENREYCLACRQYFIEISSEKDFEKAEHDIEEYHYQ